MKDKVNKIIKYLPNEVKDNLCFKELVQILLSKINDESQVSVSEDILNKTDLKEEDKVSSLVGKTKLIFSLDMDSDDLTFKVIEDDGYIIDLILFKEQGENGIEVYTNVIIKNGITSLKCVESLMDKDGYYLDYKANFYSYNKNYERLSIPLLENRKDDDFINFFGVSETKVRECRLNFKENMDYINECKVKVIMETIDQAYIDNGVMFSSVMKSCDIIDNIMYGIHEDDEEYEDYEDEAEDYEEIDYDNKKIDSLESMLRPYLGYEGEVVLSYNLILNIRTYLDSEAPFLYTNGIILRKIDNEYTMFNISFMHENIIVISKIITKEEAKNLYFSDESNESTQGLQEFFEVINKKRRDK